MKRIVLVCAAAVMGAPTGLKAAADAPGVIELQEMTLTVPDGWTMKQDAEDAGTLLLGFSDGEDYLRIYVKEITGLDMRDVFVNDGAEVERDIRDFPRGGYDWKVLQSSKRMEARQTTYHVTSFKTELNGYTYYGYSRSESQDGALENVNRFLRNLR